MEDRKANYAAWSVVALLSGAFVINYVDRQVVFSIFPLLHKEMGFSNAQLGLAGTLFTWTYSLAMPFSGRMADLFSRRKLIVTALVLWSLATLMTGLTTTVGLFLFSRICMGLCESLYVPAAIGMITQAHPGATRSRALSIHGFAQYLGITTGGWYGGWAADHIGWRQGFFTLTAIGLLYSSVLFRALPAGSFARDMPPRQTGYARFFQSWRFIALSVLFFFFCSVLWLLYAWLPSFIYERYALTLTGSGLAATLYLQCGSAAGVILGGILGDFLAMRYAAARLQVVIWSLIACAPFGVTAFAVHSLIMMKASAACFGLFAGFLMANLFSSLYDVVGKNDYGLAVGIVNTLGGAGAGASILLAGVWNQSVGIEKIMTYSSCLCIISSLFLFAAVRNHSVTQRRLAQETLGQRS